MSAKRLYSTTAPDSTDAAFSSLLRRSSAAGVRPAARLTGFAPALSSSTKGAPAPAAAPSRPLPLVPHVELKAPVKRGRAADVPHVLFEQARQQSLLDPNKARKQTTLDFQPVTRPTATPSDDIEPAAPPAEAERERHTFSLDVCDTSVNGVSGSVGRDAASSLHIIQKATHSLRGPAPAEFQLLRVLEASGATQSYDARLRRTRPRSLARRLR